MERMRPIEELRIAERLKYPSEIIRFKADGAGEPVRETSFDLCNRADSSTSSNSPWQK